MNTTLRKFRIQEMTWKEVQEALDHGVKTVFIAVGANEQHGPQTPLGEDTFLGQEIAERTARKLGDALVAPPISIGCSRHHMEFAGTISFRTTTLMNIVLDYFTSLEYHGFENIVFIQQHGGNAPAMQSVIEDLNWDAATARVLHIVPWRYVSASFGTLYGVERGFHANDVETSLMLAVRPDLVDMSKASPAVVERPDLFHVDSRILQQMHAPYTPGRGGLKLISDSGAFGHPEEADKEYGEKLLEDISTNLAHDLRKIIDNSV